MKNSDFKNPVMALAMTVAMLFTSMISFAQVTAYDEGVNGDLGGILTIANPDDVTLTGANATTLVFDVKGSVTSVDRNDIFTFNVPAGLQLSSVVLQTLTKNSGGGAVNVDAFFYIGSDADPLGSFDASITNLTSGPSGNLIAALTPPLNAGDYTTRVDFDGAVGNFSYTVRITLQCAPVTALTINDGDADFCAGETDDMARQVRVNPAPPTGEEIVWRLLSVPSGSAYSAGQTFTNASPGNDEFNITGNGRNFRLRSNPMNAGTPVFGTYSVEAFMRNTAGCTSATVGPMTLTVGADLFVNNNFDLDGINPDNAFCGTVCNGASVNVDLFLKAAVGAGLVEGTDYTFKLLSVQHRIGDCNSGSGYTNGYGPVSGTASIGSAVTGTFSHDNTQTVWLKFNLQADGLTDKVCQDGFRSFWIGILPKPKMDFTFNNPTTAFCTAGNEMCNGDEADIDLKLIAAQTGLFTEGTDFQIKIVSVQYRIGGDCEPFTAFTNGYGPVTGSEAYANGEVISQIKETLSHNEMQHVWIKYNLVLDDLSSCNNDNFRSIWVKVEPKPKMDFVFNNPATAFCTAGNSLCNGDEADIDLILKSGQSVYFTEGTDFQFKIVSVQYRIGGDCEPFTAFTNGYGPVTGSEAYANGEVISQIKETLSHDEMQHVWIKYNLVLDDLSSCNNDDFRSIWVKVEAKPKLENCPADFTVNTSNNGTEDCTASATWTHPTLVGAIDACNYILEISIDGEDFEAVTPGGAASATLEGGDGCETAHTVSYRIARSSVDDALIEGLCDFTIKVKDDENPVVDQTPGALDRSCSCEDATCIQAAQALFPTAKDNCDTELTPTAISGIVLGDCPNAYTIQRTFTFEDDCGNNVSYFQTITVYDNTKPVFGEPNPGVITLYTSEGASCPKEYDLTGLEEGQMFVGEAGTYTVHGFEFDTPNANASDNCTADENLKLTVTNIEENVDRGNSYCDREIQITFRLEDECGNFRNRTVVYRIEDDTAPEFTTAPQCLEITCTSPRDVEDQIGPWLASYGGAQAADNCTPALDIKWFRKLLSVEGSGCNICYTYEFSIKDLCGNITAATAQFCAGIEATVCEEEEEEDDVDTNNGGGTVSNGGGGSNGGNGGGNGGRNLLSNNNGKEEAQEGKAGINKSVKLYPNPAKGELYLDLSSYIGKAVNVRIVNSLGQAMQELKIQEVQNATERMELSNYTEGLYFVSIQAQGEEKVTKKFVVKQ